MPFCDRLRHLEPKFIKPILANDRPLVRAESLVALNEGESVITPVGRANLQIDVGMLAEVLFQMRSVLINDLI
ncbi:hypothetical protein D3C74_335270 [compost metagenome]